MESVNSTSTIGNLVSSILGGKAKASRRPAAQAGPRRFQMEGRLNMGNTTEFAINERDFVIDDATWVFGDLAIGKQVVVRGVQREDGSRYATRILLKQGG